MVELCLMTSHGYPHGFVFHPEQAAMNRVLKDCPHFLHFQGLNKEIVASHSLALSLNQIVEYGSANGLSSDTRFARINFIGRPAIIDFQDSHPNSTLFSFGIAEHFARQEKILKLLTSVSSGVDGSRVDLSVLCELMGCQAQIRSFPEQTFSPYYRWHFSDTEPHLSLMYPTSDLVGDFGSNSEIICHSDGQPFTGTEIDDALSVIAEFYLSKNSMRTSKPSMLVPYFERRRRGGSATTLGSKLGTVKVAPVKNPGKVKEKTSHKKRSNKTNGRERDVHRNGYIYACESLLSIIVNRKQQGKNVIFSLKKSGPELPQLLTQCSASIAGTGLAVLFSVACQVVSGTVPFCASKVLNTGLGLGLVWLSWAVNKLRDTVISITKNSSRLSLKDDEMMKNLDRSLKDIYLRVVTLLAVAALRFA